MPLRIGLTGGAAAGKSTVAAAFARLGVTVLSADALAHALTGPGSPQLAAIRERFGEAALNPDGTLDRPALAARVFASAADRAALEAILHPPIRTALADAAAEAPGPYCVLEIPLLSADDRGILVDRVLVIDAPPELQRARLATRPGMGTALVERVLGAQMTREDRLRLADDVFVNDGPPEAIAAAVGALHAFYLELAATGDTGRPGLRLPVR